MDKKNLALLGSRQKPVEHHLRLLLGSHLVLVGMTEAFLLVRPGIPCVVAAEAP